MSAAFTILPGDLAYCRCGDRRGNHNGPKYGGACLGDREGEPCAEGCSRFRWEAADKLRARAEAAAKEHPRVALNRWDAGRRRSGQTRRARSEGRWGVGPSDHSSCQKWVEYRERPPADYTPVWVDKSAAHMGTLIDLGFKRARRARYPWRKFAGRVQVPGLDVEGEYDEWDPIIGRLTDYKSAGSYKWERIGKYGPPEAEWKQALEYGLALEDAGQTVRELELIYVNREGGTMEPFYRAYSRVLALAALADLHAMIDALEAGRPLPRVKDGEDMLGPTVNPLCARFCPAVRHCWGLGDVPEERSPEGWLLARDDAGVEAALVMYDEARERASEGDKAKKYARVLLEGVEAGAYGEINLNWSGGKESDPIPDAKGRVEQLEGEMDEAIAEHRIPKAPADLPWPTFTKTSARTINVSRKRMARKEAAARREAEAS